MSCRSVPSRCARRSRWRTPSRRCAQGFVDLAAGHFEMPTRTALRDGQLLDMACHHRPSGTAVFKLLSLNFAGRQPAILGSVVWSDVEGSDAARRRRHRGDHDPHRRGVRRRDRPAGAGGRAAAGGRRHRRAGRRPGPRGPRRTTSRAAGARRPRPRPRRRPGRAARRRAPRGRRRRDDRPGGGARRPPRSSAARPPPPSRSSPSTRCPREVHVNAIGSYRPTMRELPDALLGDGLVVVDERGAILEEAGEVLHALDAGVLGVDDLVELGVAADRRRGPRRRVRPSSRSASRCRTGRSAGCSPTASSEPPPRGRAGGAISPASR